jgi:hypothetical protein
MYPQLTVAEQARVVEQVVQFATQSALELASARQ